MHTKHSPKLTTLFVCFVPVCGPGPEIKALSGQHDPGHPEGMAGVQVTLL